MLQASNRQVASKGCRKRAADAAASVPLHIGYLLLEESCSGTQVNQNPLAGEKY